MVFLVLAVLLAHDVPLARHLSQIEQDRTVTAIERDAFTYGARLSPILIANSEDKLVGIQSVLDEYSTIADGIVVVIDADGYLLASNDPTVTVGADYVARPEIAAALLGGFLASGPEVSQGLPLKPVLLSLSAAFFFGFALVFMAIGSQSSALMTMTMMRTTTLLIGIGIFMKFRHVGGLGKPELPILIFIGVADFAANLLLGVATTKGLVSLAMVLGSLYPIATALLAYKFLHERLHKVQYVGIAFAVVGVALISTR